MTGAASSSATFRHKNSSTGLRAASRRQQRLSALDWAFAAVMFLINLQEILEVFGEDSIFKPYRVASLVLAVFAFPRMIRQWNELRPFLLPFFVAYSYAFVVTAVFAGVNPVIYNIPYLVTALACLVSASATSGLRALYLGCYAYLFGMAVSTIAGLVVEGPSGRFGGMFNNPNYYGYAACIAIIFLMGPNLSIPSMLRSLSILLCFGLIFMTGSRTALVVLAVAFGTQVVKNPKLMATLIISAAALIPIAWIWEDGRDSFTDTSAAAINRYSASEVERGGRGRIEIAKAGLTVAYQTTFVGVGLDQFREKYFERFFRIKVRRRSGQNSKKWRQLGTHNAYVTLLCEWGMVGLFSFLLIVWRVFHAAAKTPEFKIWIQGFLWSSLVYGLTGNVHDIPHFLLIFGFSLQLIRFSRHESIKAAMRARSHRLALSNAV